MTAFEAYCLYIGLKNHFTQTTYDYFKYNGKSTASIESFNKRIDKYFFVKLAKHKDPKGFLIANLIADQSFWVGQLTHNQQTNEIYKQWLKRKQSLQYQFKEDLKKIPPNKFQQHFLVQNNHPKVIVLFLQNQISLESLCIMIDSIQCYSYLNKQLNDDVVWDYVGKLIRKYTPFIEYDKKHYRKLIKEYVNSTNTK
jgi:hypothetical protein